jgi:hypothetical protein
MGIYVECVESILLAIRYSSYEKTSRQQADSFMLSTLIKAGKPNGLEEINYLTENETLQISTTSPGGDPLQSLQL